MSITKNPTVPPVNYESRETTIFSLCIHQLFEQQVENNPDLPALEYNNNILTYKELNENANKLAHYLKNDITPDSKIGVCFEKSFELIVSILAILKLGATYVPLDPKYPTDRLLYMEKDSDVTMILIQDKFNHIFQNTQTKKLNIDLNSDIFKSDMSSNLDLSLDPNVPAYVIYTSGSTGQPKGILINHKGLNNIIIESNKIFNVNSMTKLLQFASISFDVSVWEIFMALIGGATLVFGSSNTDFTINNIVKIINDHNITMVLLAPSLLAVLPPEKFPTLEVIVSVGERCTNEVVKKWADNCKLYNGYGPAECSITSSVYLTKTDDNFILGPPIGKEVDNVKMYILDQNLNRAPINTVGEIYISGIGLANGYHNQKELNEEKFVTNPHAPYQRLYKTGDLGRLLDDGNFEFVGRNDSQVKIRGFRIELGEIESVLNASPEVKNSIILKYENNGDAFLTGFVIPATNDCSVDQLNNRLLAKLPEYMVPKKYLFLETFPLSPNGKISRKQLLALFEEQNKENDVITESDESLNDIEKRLMKLWKEKLNTEAINKQTVLDDICDSIMRLKLQIAMEHEFNFEFKVEELILLQTFNDFAQNIQQSIA